MRSTLRNVSSWPILLKKSKIVPAHHSLDQKSGELNNVKQYPMGKQPNWVEIVDRIHD
jgi:hypothetical protein